MHDDRFHIRWRGYDRREVDAELARLRDEVEVLRVDRDAAVATAEDLVRELEDARSELGEYRVLHAGYSKDNAVSGCIRYLMHVARQKADAFESDARERSEQMLRQAEEVARRQAVLLDQTEQETQRRLAEAEQRAREIVAAARAGAAAPGRWEPPDVPGPRIVSGPMQVVPPDAQPLEVVPPDAQPLQVVPPETRPFGIDPLQADSLQADPLQAEPRGQ
ncbi:DivIVA domain-containing protein [Saccharothrix syringae]|uniref:DivIVA domain-containing protein n=1 Tax=Saccharothrix syringae TaxID=103733 RepID=A0A5Q0H826_SACSY|nr:hypothetical protein [Saccharothrix syringae]QFZ21990.1 hypothetical protein EKG83_35350 [Saccharothrix syringae]